MTTLEQQLKWAEQHQAAYRPSQEVQDALGEITLALIIGPSSIGKSYIIHKVVERNSDFSEAGTITTRAPRPDDPEAYRAGIAKEEMIERIRERSLVQYAVHPTSREIYASDVASYPTRFGLLPTLASSVGEFDNLGFKKVIPIGLLANGEDWQTRLQDREGSKDFAKRLAEAKKSVLWIQEHAGEIVVLENQTGQDQLTAEIITRITKGQSVETLSSQAINQLSLGILAVISAKLGET